MCLVIGLLWYYIGGGWKEGFDNWGVDCEVMGDVCLGCGLFFG